MTQYQPGPTQARRVLLGFTMTLAAILYIDRVCIAQSQHLISEELGQACCFPDLTRAFSNWFRGEDRTRVQCLMGLAARWGGAFTPLLVVFVLGH